MNIFLEVNLKFEYLELNKKIAELVWLRETSISDAEKVIINKQLVAMHRYSECLLERIKLIKNEQEN